MLRSATEDFQEYVNARERKAKQLFCEAEEWFLDETSDSLFSFENICEVLRIKPTKLALFYSSTAWLLLIAIVGPMITLSLTTDTITLVQHQPIIFLDDPFPLVLLPLSQPG